MTDGETTYRFTRRRVLRLVANAKFSEGDEVETPSGPGVVVEIRMENFDGPDGDEVEASSDDPAYIVGVESGAAVYREDELSEGEIPGPSNPEQDLGGEQSANVVANQRGHFNYPPSWRKSETPSRLILLKAWAAMGGRFRTCRREMANEVVRVNAFCADMKDRVLGGWEGWREGG